MSDYLFDKSGRDEDVEGLEDALGQFAYDGDAPELPEPKPVVSLPTRARRDRDEVAYRGPLTSGFRWPLAAALVFGLLAAVLSYSAIQKQQADVRKGWNLVPVVVAAVDVSEGTVVTMEMMSQRSVPEQFVTSSVVKPDSASYVVNQKILVAVAAGDPLLWSQFETNRASERLSTKIQKRARALALDVKGVTSVGGWMRPNDHVDIIGSFKDPQSGEQVAVTLMQNVVVLSTGKITGTTNVNLVPEGQRDYSNVSLLVLPEEAEMLVLAQELGALTFTLRNEEDVDVLDGRGRATINTLLSGERTKVLQMKRLNTIQVIRGAASPTPEKQ